MKLLKIKCYVPFFLVISRIFLVILPPNKVLSKKYKSLRH